MSSQHPKITNIESDYSGNTVLMSKQGYQDLVGTSDGRNLFWTTDVKAELPIKMPSTGIASEIRPDTLSNVMRKTAKERGDAPALRIQRGKDLKEYTWTWNQYYGESFAFARSLQAVGVEERKAVNIFGYNSPEWAICFFGSIIHNNVVSGVYITNGPEACHYQAEHSEAEVIVVDTAEQLKLYMGLIDSLPMIKAVVAWGIDSVPAEYASDSRVYTYKGFLEIGKKVNDDEITQIVNRQKPGQCCVLIYTSGTTGNPKGVMLSHDNIVFNGSSVGQDLIENPPSPDEQINPTEMRVVSYLPLSHIAGLQFDLVSTLLFGATLYFARPDALQGSLVESLQWARPTLFLAVPRVWEKFEDKLKQIAATKPAILQSISGWAKGHGLEKVMGQIKGQESGLMFSMANAIILKKIKEAIGLDQTLFFFFGAAPLKQSSIEYFASLDIPLMNLYGLSETTGTTTVSYLNDMSLQHAGEQMCGAHVKIAEQDENGVGEIRIYGRHVMMGYLKNEEATRDCIDENGYFKTGDQGRLDGRFLKITGRIKELIITAGGENVAPVPIEDFFKGECPVCSNIMLVGENQRFMGALITFKVDIDMKTGLPSNILVPEVVSYFKTNLGLDVKTSDEACANQKIFEHVQECVLKTNKKVVSKAAHIKKFTLLPVDFSQPGGELTPTMKLKRKVTEQKYQAEVDKIYAVQAKI